MSTNNIKITHELGNIFSWADDRGLFQDQTWTLAALGNLLSHKDFGTKGHSDRVPELMMVMGRKIGLKPADLADLRLFAQFHDLGKVLIPDNILFKEGPLSESEWGIMKMHCEIGARIARSFNEISHLAEYILYHHERWDGHGYPHGINGLEIPLFCRILSIADSWDAMTNDRPYRKAMSATDAIREIETNAGKQFDPTLVDVWRSL